MARPAPPAAACSPSLALAPARRAATRRRAATTRRPTADGPATTTTTPTTTHRGARHVADGRPARRVRARAAGVGAAAAAACECAALDGAPRLGRPVGDRRSSSLSPGSPATPTSPRRRRRHQPRRAGRVRQRASSRAAAPFAGELGRALRHARRGTRGASAARHRSACATTRSSRVPATSTATPTTDEEQAPLDAGRRGRRPRRAAPTDGDLLPHVGTGSVARDLEAIRRAYGGADGLRRLQLRHLHRPRAPPSCSPAPCRWSSTAWSTRTTRRPTCCAARRSASSG